METRGEERRDGEWKRRRKKRRKEKERGEEWRRIKIKREGEKRGKERISRYDIESLTTDDPTLCSDVFGSVSVSLSLLFSAD